ncbi:glycosyltransferase [Chondrinema litorale]|uniref:glycosyltransferase n=1 Tax=Chondrinema litorale TaxID=2994555 RepID=UPI002542B43C|nr:glycosyltransferase [Chondrinema litorale]UZR92542.1 glycosyltransferase [Chondrinema litorale]
MKTILILAYDFPPFNSIGAQRPASWFKYLKKYGWSPIVVTRHWDDAIKNSVDYIKPSKERSTTKQNRKEGELIQAPFNPNIRDRWILKYGLDEKVIQRKVLTLGHQFVKFSHPKTDSSYSIYQAADDFLRSNKVDVILATGEPFILFKYAALLSKKYKTPWIADYRDCWTNNPSLKGAGKMDRWLNEKHFRKIEKKLIESCKLITTAAPSYKNDIALLHPKKNIEVVLNGYDVKEQSAIVKPDSNKFTISYAGIIYPHQKLETFLDGLKLFLNEMQDVEVYFYGLKFYPEMVERVRQSIAEKLDSITFTERIPYEEIHTKLKESHLLLLLSAKNMNWLNAKIFDYLQANRKILLVENDNGILNQIIEECNAGITADTPEEVANVLEKYYVEFKNTGEVKQQTINYEQYSRENQAKHLASLLDKYIY